LSLTVGQTADASAQATDPTPAVSLYGVVPRDTTAVTGLSTAEQAAGATIDPAQKPKRGELFMAPLPMVNPTIENGLALVGGYLYRLDASDKATPPSGTAAGGFKTSNGSWAAMALQSLHLWHDKVRVRAVGAYSDVNYAFYGIGQDAGDAGLSVELNQTGPVGLVESLLRVAPHWYVGARYQFLDMTVKARSPVASEDPIFPARDTTLKTAALGPRVEFDTRGNPFYPRGGTQFMGIANFYGEGVGGRRTYQQYQAWVNRYHSIGPRNVIAWHAGVCGVDGPAPFYDLCMLGKSSDLRGYTIGQYRDRAMVAAQVEWRTELWWRFGATAFLGGGEVAEKFGALALDDTLPGGGLGLRFVLAKRNHVNLRVDYAWGKNSNALYVSVAEAF
jgi:hypothetical protein